MRIATYVRGPELTGIDEQQLSVKIYLIDGRSIIKTSSVTRGIDKADSAYAALIREALQELGL